MIAIIDYGAGNLRSIGRALQAAGEETVITADPEVIRAADGVVLPGVGAAGHAMDRLDEKQLVPIIHEVVERGTPFLGVCLGMQLLFEHQEEGNANGLGLMKGSVRTIRNAEKIPHIGWNQSTVRKPLPGLEPGDAHYYYFVHSFVAEPDDPADVAATSEYGEQFPSVVVRDNVWGTQFHPEKSSEDGLALIKSWVETVRTSSRQGAGTR